LYIQGGPFDNEKYLKKYIHRMKKKFYQKYILRLKGTDEMALSYIIDVTIDETNTFQM